MEGYTSHFTTFDDINVQVRNPFYLYFGYIEIKNGYNVISKFEFDIIPNTNENCIEYNKIILGKVNNIDEVSVEVDLLL